MFSLRTLPWGLLLPAALIHGWQARDRRAERGLVLAWIASVLVLFSLASGRLEHYSLPALPAIALLVGDLVAETAAGRSRVSRLWLVVPPAAVAGLALVLAAREPAGIIRELDPTLELRDSNGMLLISNDNWQNDPNSAAQLIAHGLAPQNSLESGIFASLPSGAFTAILTGKSGGTGIGLVEIYDVH